VTVDQFAVFAKETGHDTGSVCDIWQDGKWSERQGYSWRKSAFSAKRFASRNVPELERRQGPIWLGCRARPGTIIGWRARPSGNMRRGQGAVQPFHFGSNVGDYCRYGKRGGSGGGQGRSRRDELDAPFLQRRPCLHGSVGKLCGIELGLRHGLEMCSNGSRIAGKAASNSSRRERPCPPRSAPLPLAAVVTTLLPK